MNKKLVLAYGIYEGEVKSGFRNGYGKMTYNNGDVYEGNWLYGERHGKGKMTYKNGGVYEGEWIHDFKREDYNALKKPQATSVREVKTASPTTSQAKKRLVLADGIYEGEVKSGFRNGYGKMTYNNGDVYEGNWLYGERHGKGKMTYKNGGVYEGEWINGFKREDHNALKKTQAASVHGVKTASPTTSQVKKRLVLADGTYEGGVRQGTPFGKGKMTYKNGDVYEGNWIWGKRDGKGKMTYKNGDVYEGNWFNGKRDGIGKMTYDNGDVYKGMWINDSKREADNALKKPQTTSVYGAKTAGHTTSQAKKRLVLADGIYEGSVSNGKPHGNGKMTYKNGDVYEGDFVNGKGNGKGIFTSADGDVREGRFVDDLFVKGKYTIVDDGIYEGKFDDEMLLIGEGKIFYANGDIYEGSFYESVLHGKGKITYADGTVEEGTYIYGELVKE